MPVWPGPRTPHGADPYNQYPPPVGYPAPQQSGYAPYQASGYPPTYAQYVPVPYPVPVRRPVSGWLLLGAGIAATGGTLLPWTTQTVLFIGTYSASGLQTPIGQITAMAGVLLLGFGIWCIAGSQPPLAIRVLGVIGFVGVLASRRSPSSASLYCGLKASPQ